MLKKIALAAALLGSLTLAPAYAEPIGEDDVIYFPMTDRFYRGTPHRDVELQPADPKGFHGGDLKGLTQKADYIKGLGVTTLWLSPFMLNTDEHHFGDYVSKGYHGYWVHDHYKVETRQGTVEDLQECVKTYKGKGIKVIADIVLNQVGPDHPWVKDPSKRDWFHHEGPIQNYEDQHQAEYGDLGGLPDLNQDNPEVYEFLLKNTAYWIKTLDLDGIRLDAVKHIPKTFWKRFIPDLRKEVGKPDLFVLGEVFKGDPDYLSDYQKIGLDYLYDFAMHGTLTDVFGKDASAKKLGERLAQDKIYPDAHKLVTIMDNHDLPRFISVAQGDDATKIQRLELATAFMSCVRGIPCFYYGTEVALEGGQDPDNRRDMQFDRHPEVRDNFTKLMHIRAVSPALRHGKEIEMLSDDQVYAFERRSEDQEAICIFNTSAAPQKRTLSLLKDSKLDGVLVDQLTGHEIPLQGGKFTVELPARTPLILLDKN